MTRQLLIYEQDLALLLRGQAVQLDDDVTVTFSAVLSIEFIAALVATELSALYTVRARDGAVLPETRRRLSLAVDNEAKSP